MSSMLTATLMGAPSYKGTSEHVSSFGFLFWSSAQSPEMRASRYSRSPSCSPSSLRLIVSSIVACSDSAGLQISWKSPSWRLDSSLWVSMESLVSSQFTAYSSKWRIELEVAFEYFELMMSRSSFELSAEGEIDVVSGVVFGHRFKVVRGIFAPGSEFVRSPLFKLLFTRTSHSFELFCHLPNLPELPNYCWPKHGRSTCEILRVTLFCHKALNNNSLFGKQEFSAGNLEIVTKARAQAISRLGSSNSNIFDILCLISCVQYEWHKERQKKNSPRT